MSEQISVIYVLAAVAGQSRRSSRATVETGRRLRASESCRIDRRVDSEFV